MSKSGRILIIEDDPYWQDLLQRNLIREQYNVEIASSLQEAITKLERSLYHLAIVDIRLVDWDAENTEGMTILDELDRRELGTAIEKVILSAYGTIPQMRKAFKSHKVADFLEKDKFDLEQFINTVGKIFTNGVQINFDLEIVLEDGLTFEELLIGVDVQGKRLKKDSPLLERAIEEATDLFQRLFYTAKTVVLHRIASPSSFHSASHVVKVQPYYADRHGEPVIVKIGDYKSIDIEYSNFQAYVQGFIGGSRSTNSLGLRRTPWFGGIIYSLVGAGLERADNFSAFYQRHSFEEVLATLTNLFESTCANWYADRGVVQHCRLTQEYRDRLGFDDSKLEGALKDNFPSLLNQKIATLREVPNRRLVNPIYAVRGRDLSRSTYQCITHGDLNGGNIIVDPSKHAWLIDFASTGKGHILRDVIELETVIKFELLDSQDLAARATFEEALASINRFSLIDKVDYAPPDEQFEKAFRSVSHLRQIARDLVHPNDDFSEYDIGLLYMALNMQRFYGVPKPNRLHALISASLICEKLGLQV